MFVILLEVVAREAFLNLEYGVREFLASNYTQPAEYLDSQPAKW